MLFTPKAYIDSLPIILLNGTILELVNSLLYLGFNLDRKLNFNLHFDKVLTCLSKFVGMFYAVRNFASVQNMMKIYNSLVLPNIQQNIIIWGCLTEEKKNKINVKINKILRCILNISFNDNYVPNIHTSEMYKSLNTLKFDDIYDLFLLKFLHFVMYKNTKLFNEYFADLLPGHCYSTRQTRILLPRVRLEIEKRSTIYQCCKLLNSLHEKFISPQSDVTLKKNYKEFCFAGY